MPGFTFIKIAGVNLVLSIVFFLDIETCSDLVIIKYKRALRTIIPEGEQHHVRQT